MIPRKKGIRISYVSTLLLLIIATCTILTCVIPAGQYETCVDENDAEILVNGSYHRIEQIPVIPMKASIAVQEGPIETAYISAFIFVIGDAFGAVVGTKAIEAGTGRITEKTPRRQELLIPIMIFVVGFDVGSFGMFEECLVFIPLLIPICIAVGYDSITGLAVATVSSPSSCTGSFVQAADIGVSQSITGLPMYSTMWYCLIILVVTLTIAAVYIYLYAQHTKRDPTRNLMHKFDRQREEKVDLNDLPELTGTRKLVLLAMGATSALLIMGMPKWGWHINEPSTLFLGMGIVVGFVARVSFDGFGRPFSHGVADFAADTLAAGFAHDVLIVLKGGNIFCTILYGVSGLLTLLSSSPIVLDMYVFQNFPNLLIPSTNGQTVTFLPIPLPMGNTAGVTQQTTCAIFQIGNGLSNILVPASGIFMVALTMAKVPYDKWTKWFIPLLGLQFVADAVLVLIANTTRLGLI